MKRTYATLSFYSSNQEDIDELCNGYDVDFRRVSKNQLFSAHYTTKEILDSVEASVHISHLSEVFHGSAETAKVRSLDGLRVVVWIYLESADENFGFDVLSDQIAWIATMGAEMFIDIWSGSKGAE